MKTIKRVKKDDPVHAYIRANFEYQHGHIYVRVYELFGYNGPHFEIACQTGGITGNKSYAFNYGLASSSRLIQAEGCRIGSILMRKIDRGMDALNDVEGYCSTFAEYAARILLCANIRRAYINPRVNGGIANQITDLPCLDPVLQNVLLREAITPLEDALLLMS